MRQRRQPSAPAGERRQQAPAGDEAVTSRAKREGRQAVSTTGPVHMTASSTCSGTVTTPGAERHPRAHIRGYARRSLKPSLKESFEGKPTRTADTKRRGAEAARQPVSASDLLGVSRALVARAKARIRTPRRPGHGRPHRHGHRRRHVETACPSTPEGTEPTQQTHARHRTHDWDDPEISALTPRNVGSQWARPSSHPTTNQSARTLRPRRRRRDDARPGCPGQISHGPTGATRWRR